MITEKTRQDLEKALEKIQNGLLASSPAMEECVKEMQRVDKEFKKLSESVRSKIGIRVRRTTAAQV